MESEGFRMSDINEVREKQDVPGYEQLAEGLTLLVWTIASSIIIGGLCQSGGYMALSYAMTGGVIIVFLTPIGALLFASGLGRILKNTRT
jgi:hypothetical protein